MQRSNPIKVLVVEDKAIVAKDIASSLEDFGYTVMGTVKSGEEALASVRTDTPDLILMDIHLKGELDGIQTAKIIVEEKPTPIIYLTAYSDNATLQRAKQTHPFAYIVKPFDEKDLQIAIDLAIHNFAARKNEDKPVPDGKGLFLNDCLFIKKDNRYYKLPTDDIFFIEADGSYVKIVCKDQSYTLAINLQYVQDHITYDAFMRVHRSFIVNLKHVSSFEYARLFIEDHEIPISRVYRENFRSRFPQL